MTPTLFAEDLLLPWGNITSAAVHCASIQAESINAVTNGLVALAYISPRRCDEGGTDGRHRGCGCEGRGWLYPSIPDWWHTVMNVRIPAEFGSAAEGTWRVHCRDTWRAMGVTNV